MRPYLSIFVLFAVVICYQAESFAKAYFQSKKQMIESAQAIAVVSIGEVEAIEKKGKHWTYRQRAKIRVDSVLKGDLSDEFFIYGAETFICAQCNLKSGDYIVFLKKVGDLWTGSNWHLSLREIKGDKVSWFAGSTNWYEMIPVDRNKVIEEIRAVLD